MVSVIVPVYNVELFLTECIESIINQTFEDLDIILIDDGSTDSSGDICDYYASIDNRIRVFHKKNGGLSDARNYGINLALGKEITLVDSDDVIMPNMIETLVSIKEDNNAQLSVCYRIDINEKGEIINQKSYQSSEIVVATNTHDCFQKYFECSGAGVVAWGKLYDRHLFDDIKYPVGRYNEDVFTTYKLIAKCTNIAITKQGLYLYRHRSGSIMNRDFELKHLDMIKGASEMTDYLEKAYPDVAFYAQNILYYTAIRTWRWMCRSRKYNNNALALIKQIIKQYYHESIGAKHSWKVKLLSHFILRCPNSFYQYTMQKI